ncbi:MAG: methyltransferase domain-containing protein [Stellaceae bacterium]
MPSDALAAHRRVWSAKAGLRFYYRREIFDRIVAAMAPGPSLELGAGPGFFAEHHPGAVMLDIVPGQPGSLCADAHRLPFRDRAFANVVGVDVVHHLARPGEALREAARVLAPGGRLVLVEPWAGPFGRLFYRHLHHEDCRWVADPWKQAFAPGKDPMDGNAMIPRLLFAASDARLVAAGLRLERAEFFGIVAYAATGGFQRVGLPRRAIAALCRLEAQLPAALRRLAGLRALFVLERVAK